MKKLYSILLFALVAMIGMSANARTVTLTSNPEATVLYHDGSDFVAVGTEGVSITCGDYDYLTIKAADGYKLMKVITKVPGANDVTSFDWSSDPQDQTSLYMGAFPDGCTAVVQTKLASEIVTPTVTFNGTAEQYYVQYNYSNNYPDAEGVVSIQNYSSYSSFMVYPASGYKLVSITDQNDKSYDTNYYGYGYAYISAGSFSDTEMTFTVVTEELQASQFSVTVIGDPSSLVMQDASYTDHTFTNETQSFDFYEGQKFNFRNKNYGKFWKFVVNDVVKQEFWSSYYSFAPNAGDEVVIYTDIPDYDIDFSMSFVNCENDIISAVSVNSMNVNKDVWSADGWAPKFGDEVSISLNTTDYGDVVLNYNGEDHEMSGYTNYYRFTVNDPEAKYEVKISGTKLDPYTITVLVDGDWEAVNINKGAYALTGEETQLSVSRSDAKSGLTFSAASSDYYIAAVSTSTGETIYSNTVYVSEDNMEIYVVVDKLERDKTMVVFLEDTEWYYLSFILGYQYDWAYKVEDFGPGYNFIDFGNIDIPYQISCYPVPSIYLNGKYVESNYGEYDDLKNVEDGDVIKIFASTPAEHEVEYVIADDVNVAVYHDYVTAIDSPATHTVFAGTIVHIDPVTTFSDEYSPITVKVNEVEILPTDGRYSFTVNEATKVSVSKTYDGIDAVTVDGNATQGVYNLQGVKIDNKIENLPAGIYIVNGVKVRK